VIAVNRQKTLPRQRHCVWCHKVYSQ